MYTIMNNHLFYLKVPMRSRGYCYISISDIKYAL